MVWMRLSKLIVIVALGLATAALCACSPKDSQTDLTIATVNNGDMVVMRKLAASFEQANPTINLRWVVLDENVLRQRITTDIATGAGQFDVITVGNNEAPIWAKQGWLRPVTGIAADYDVDDLLEPVRQAASYNGALHALPFYAESAMTYYRTDLFEAAGLSMPANPTYADIARLAARLDDDARQVYGLCLRGKPGWRENMATVTAMVHAFGGRWFDESWHAAIDTPQWRRALDYYTTMLRDYGPPDATSNGFDENLILMSSGHCAIWIDATIAASMLYNGKSNVAGKIGYAPMPTAGDSTAPTWLWSWNLAIPTSSKHADAATKFISWATSKDYIRQAAKSEGWVSAPPGTRQSTYDAAEYRQAAPFAGFVLNAINTAMPTELSKVVRPYGGAQFAAIPEFHGIGTHVGQSVAGALSGQATVDAALKEAQAATDRTMQQAGYPK